MTREQYINREISTWGFDYIADLFDRGYEVRQLTNSHGESKWSWVLTEARPRASLEVGSIRGFTPVFPRASRL